MNFSYDLKTWIEYIIGGFACCLGMFLTEKTLLEIKFNEIKWTRYLFLIPFSLFIVINTLIFDSIAKIFGSFIILYLIITLIFKKSSVDSFLYGLVTYILFILSEIAILMFAVLIESIFIGNVEVMFFAKTIIINVGVALLSVICAKILKNKIKKLVNILNKNRIIYIVILGIVAIFVLISSLYSLYINKWQINYKFILNTVIIIGCLTLVIVLLKQYLQNKEINDKYILLKDYLKTSAELIEKYSSTVHKYKNNLIAIKGYLKSDLKDADEYIDNLLGDYKDNKYNWFRKINYIQLDSIRYLIYYKLSKAESENLKITVDVSNDIRKYENEIFTVKESNILLEIIGEYFDNAIYASSESKEKELNFMLYGENNQLKFVIANTYKGHIDLSLIIKNGYTTKGKGHGLGLYDIEKTLKKNEWLKAKYELMDNYFITTFSIFINKESIEKLHN